MEKKVKVETFPSTNSAAIHGQESESKNLSIHKERGNSWKVKVKTFPSTKSAAIQGKEWAVASSPPTICWEGPG